MKTKRVKKLKELMERRGVDSLLISDANDIYYYTGYRLTGGDTGFAVVNSDGSRPVLFVSPLNSDAERLKGVEVRFAIKLEEIEKSFEGIVGYDETRMPAVIFEKLSRKAKLVKASDIIKAPRETKDEKEIEMIAKSSGIVKRLMKGLNVWGKTEMEVAEEIAAKCITRGVYADIDTIIVSSGSNSAFIHYRPSRHKISKGPVIIDIAGRYGFYYTDITRTFFNRPSQKERSIMEYVENMQKEIIDSVEDGRSFADLQSMYERFMKKAGYRVFHSIGHGVGLEIHERPFVRDVLKSGMVITIEPGVYIKDVGGWRKEDVVLVKKQKAKVLS